MFEAKRLEIGLAVEGRLLPSGSVPATVEKSIERRSEKASAKTTGVTLSQVYDRYLADPTKRRSARTMLAHQTTRRVVEDVLGADTPIANITRDQCRDLLETLRWLPVNMAKKFGDAGVCEAAKAARADLTIRTINSTNLNAYMARFATMMNWAVTEELIGRNPARGLQVADTIHPQDRRKPFEPWQLQRIFNAPIYTGCKDEENGYSVVGSHIAVGARFWVPLICMFSGIYWETYFGEDKDRHYAAVATNERKQLLEARAFARSSLASATLQIAKQGLSAVHGNLDSIPDSRKIHGVQIREIIWQGRNQSMHWEEGNPHKGVIACFDKLTQSNPLFSSYIERSLAFEMIFLLEWRDINAFENDMMAIR